MAMIKLHLEWDCGQDRYIFHSRNCAFRWMEQNFPFDDFDGEFACVKDVFDAGYANYEELEVWCH